MKSYTLPTGNYDNLLITLYRLQLLYCLQLIEYIYCHYLCTKCYGCVQAWPPKSHSFYSLTVFEQPGCSASPKLDHTAFARPILSHTALIRGKPAAPLFPISRFPIIKRSLLPVDRRRFFRNHCRTRSMRPRWMTTGQGWNNSWKRNGTSAALCPKSADARTIGNARVIGM